MCSLSTWMQMPSRRHFEVFRALANSSKWKAVWCAGTRSFDRLRGVRWVVVWGCGGVLSAACSMPPAPALLAAPTSVSVACAGSDTVATTEDAFALAALRRSTEIGPLYAALLAVSPLESCRVSGESAAPTLTYQFIGGGLLRVKRDARIEYTEQEAQFVVPPLQAPAALLLRVERAEFGAAGCGIDWQRAELASPAVNAGAIDTVFRGDVCNCQARIRRNAAGHVVVLALRSTC